MNNNDNKSSKLEVIRSFRKNCKEITQWQGSNDWGHFIDINDEKDPVMITPESATIAYDRLMYKIQVPILTEVFFYNENTNRITLKNDEQLTFGESFPVGKGIHHSPLKLANDRSFNFELTAKEQELNENNVWFENSHMGMPKAWLIYEQDIKRSNLEKVLSILETSGIDRDKVIVEKILQVELNLDVSALSYDRRKGTVVLKNPSHNSLGSLSLVSSPHNDYSNLSEGDKILSASNVNRHFLTHKEKLLNSNIPSGENQSVVLNYAKTIIASELDQIKQEILESGFAEELNVSEWIPFPPIKTKNLQKTISSLQRNDIRITNIERHSGLSIGNVKPINRIPREYFNYKGKKYPHDMFDNSNYKRELNKHGVMIQEDLGYPYEALDITEKYGWFVSQKDIHQNFGISSIDWMNALIDFLQDKLKDIYSAEHLSNDDSLSNSDKKNLNEYQKFMKVYEKTLERRAEVSDEKIKSVLKKQVFIIEILKQYVIKEIDNDPGILKQIFSAITAPNTPSAKVDSPKKNEESVVSRSSSGRTDREDVSPLFPKNHSMFLQDSETQNENTEMFKCDP